jgi:hypothetical protein
VVKLGFTELAMDEAMAAAVLVRRDGNGVGA